ncbi:MAG: hypothetical protein HY675_11035 [Chloroflexi bacterium]|nr:hypothetical protein [Chloroflexota bacterium]
MASVWALVAVRGGGAVEWGLVGGGWRCSDAGWRGMVARVCRWDGSFVVWAWVNVGLDAVVAVLGVMGWVMLMEVIGYGRGVAEAWGDVRAVGDRV